MSKLMKNRTDNDIKNKWNSMARTQAQHSFVSKYEMRSSGVMANFVFAPKSAPGDSASDDHDVPPLTNETITFRPAQPGSRVVEASAKESTAQDVYAFLESNGPNDFTFGGNSFEA
jgi:hypothetical protein